MDLNGKTYSIETVHGRVGAKMKLKASHLLDLPAHSGSELHYLVTCGDSYAVVDDTGRIWVIRPTRLGAERVARQHRRRYMSATNHYARQAVVVAVDGSELREWALTEARDTLRNATEVECRGELNGGLSSQGALKALAVLRETGRYASWHAA